MVFSWRIFWVSNIFIWISLSNIVISSSLLKDFFSMVSWLLFLFQLIQDTIPLPSGFYCFSWEVNQQFKSWYCESNCLFFPLPDRLKDFFPCLWFSVLAPSLSIVLLLYFVWNLFGFLNMCLLKSIITFNKFFLIESSAPFPVSYTSKTFDETYARLDCYVLCRIHSIYCFPSLYLCPSLWTGLFSAP